VRNGAGDAAVTATAPRLADTVHHQYARILAHLQAEGRTSCPELAKACDVPSVTKRVSELIAAGWPIARTRGRVPTQRGGWRRGTFYELNGPHPQCDLFTSALQ